jgi:hypothetical protein
MGIGELCRKVAEPGLAFATWSDLEGGYLLSIMGDSSCRALAYTARQLFGVKRQISKIANLPCKIV